jgi:hypothetical protein
MWSGTHGRLASGMLWAAGAGAPCARHGRGKCRKWQLRGLCLCKYLWPTRGRLPPLGLTNAGQCRGCRHALVAALRGRRGGSPAPDPDLWSGGRRGRGWPMSRWPIRWPGLGWAGRAGQAGAARQRAAFLGGVRGSDAPAAGRADGNHAPGGSTPRAGPTGTRTSSGLAQGQGWRGLLPPAGRSIAGTGRQQGV